MNMIRDVFVPNANIDELNSLMNVKLDEKNLYRMSFHGNDKALWVKCPFRFVRTGDNQGLMIDYQTLEHRYELALVNGQVYFDDQKLSILVESGEFEMKIC